MKINYFGKPVDDWNDNISRYPFIARAVRVSDDMAAFSSAFYSNFRPRDGISYRVRVKLK